MVAVASLIDAHAIEGVSAFDDSELVASGSLWKDEQHFLRLILGDRYSLADQAGFSAADAGKIEFIDVISWSSKGIIGVSNGWWTHCPATTATVEL